MMMIAHKIALDPNDVQETYCRKAAGIAPVAYNGALAEWRSNMTRGTSIRSCRNPRTPPCGVN